MNSLIKTCLFVLLTLVFVSCKRDKQIQKEHEVNLYPFKGVVHARNCYFKIDILDGHEEIKKRAGMPSALAIKYLCVRNVGALEGDTIYFDCKPLNYNFFIDCQQMDTYDARMSVALVRLKRYQLIH